MFRSRKCNVLGAVTVLASLSLAQSVWSEPGVGHYGYGQPATEEQIAGWDIDVRPDGLGLPEGSGSVEDSEWIYEAKCASCHGTFGEGVDGYPSLAGGEGSLTDGRPHKTVGSYWNHTSTVWDYINRAMPYTAPRSLNPDEVYALTAYVLFLNDLIDYDFVMDDSNLAEVRLPNEPNFIPDQRPDTNNERCMSGCKDPASVTLVSIGPELVIEEQSIDAVIEVAAAGEAVYQQYCQLCHTSGLAGAPKIGDVVQWSTRLTKGIDTVYRHAIEGYQGEVGVMPAKGGFAQLTDDEVRASVDYMVQESQ
jgi:S-disulfanyl-L-cysteine oxidoreductase SoxD